MRAFIPIEKSLLEQLYQTDGLTIYDIGGCLGVSPSVIWHWMQDYGIPTRPRPIAAETRVGGYICAYRPGHPRANHSGRVKRCILAWEEANGMLMPADREPHHKNEVKDDDRPENIVALTKAEHSQMHAELRLAAKGTRSWDRLKLTPMIAAGIRHRALAGESTKVLADEFGITQGHVSNIKYGRAWA